MHFLPLQTFTEEGFFLTLRNLHNTACPSLLLLFYLRLLWYHLLLPVLLLCTCALIQTAQCKQYGDLLIKTQLDSVASYNRIPLKVLKMFCSASFFNTVCCQLLRKEKNHALFRTYHSNVFYLHTGLDKSEFGECTHAYRKP